MKHSAIPVFGFLMMLEAGVPLRSVPAYAGY